MGGSGRDRVTVKAGPKGGNLEVSESTCMESNIVGIQSAICLVSHSAVLSLV